MTLRLKFEETEEIVIHKVIAVVIIDLKKIKKMPRKACISPFQFLYL